MTYKIRVLRWLKIKPCHCGKWECECGLLFKQALDVISYSRQSLELHPTRTGDVVQHLRAEYLRLHRRAYPNA